jgi:hypothetical protein
MRLIKGFLTGLVLVGIPAMIPAAAFAHGVEAAVTYLAGEVEDTLLSVVVVTHLVDSRPWL